MGWLIGSTNTCATFNGQYGQTYGFYSVAHDGAGNIESPPGTAEATTSTPPGGPVIQQVGPQFVIVGQTLVITNHAQSANPPITFSLGGGAPAGASITINGVFAWTPSCAQGSTANQVPVWAADSGSPPQSNSMIFQVTVSDCLQVGVGSTVMQVGTTSSVPVNLLSTVALTNLSFTLSYPTNRFNNWTLTASNAAIGSVSVQTLDPTDTRFTLGTKSGQFLQGPALVGVIGFGAVSNSSASVPLTIVNVQGTKSDGTPVGNTFGLGGRVVVVGRQPLLEAWLGSDSQRMLTLYGNPGASYQVAYSTNLLRTNWASAWHVPMTNLSEVFQADQIPSQLFYRAWEFSANPPILELNSAAPTNLVLLVYGQKGSNYVIVTGTNLAAPNNWSSIAGFTMSNSFQFIGAGTATNQMKFFRAKRP